MKSYLLQLTLIFVIGFKGVVFSQKNIFNPYTSIAVKVGSSNYFGDLAPSNNILNSTYNSLRWHGGIEIGRHVSKRIGYKLNFNWVRLGADDYNSNIYENVVRNLHFRNDIKEVSIVGVYNIISENRNLFKRNKWSPYFTIGIGLFFHNPKAKTPQNLSGKWEELQPIGTEGQKLRDIYTQAPVPYSLKTLSYPFGIGVNYKFSKKWDVGVELIYRNTHTDYIDDVSGNYVNSTLIRANFGDDAGALTERRFEKIDARTGQDRTSKLLYLLAKRGQNPSNIDPYIIIFDQTINQQLNGEGQSRGNGKNTVDTFFTISLKLTYHIPDKIKCSF